MQKIVLLTGLYLTSILFAGEISIGSFSKQGASRKRNEDRYIHAIIADKDVLTGVFDGHSGDAVSEYLQNNIVSVFNKDTSPDIQTRLTNTLLTLDQKVKPLESGSTAAIAYVESNDEGKNSKVIFHTAHVGDSRIVLIDCDGNIVLSTKDHKPNREGERERIERNEGMVISRTGRRAGSIVEDYYVIRGEYQLAVSRAIGDYFIDETKKCISAEPEYNQRILQGLYYFIIGSDGLYDAMTNEEIGHYIIENKEKKLLSLAKMLVKKAIEKGSKDDITAIVGKIKTQ